MYQLLIVDDEIHAVRAVQSGVEWDELSITRIHVAYNIGQAMEIFENYPIDIMICDIEMPQGSGIELLAWVKERYSLTESIFLTCHSNFTYAKQAVQLGSLDYMLKPVKFQELKTAVQRGVGRVNEKREQLTSKQISHYYSKLWHTHQPVLIERFWQDLLEYRIPSNPERIRELLSSRNLPVPEAGLFLPILISVQRWFEKLSLRDGKIMEYALRNAADHMILNRYEHSQMVRMSDDTFLILLSADTRTDKAKEEYRRICESYIASCNRHFRCDLSCYIGEPGRIHEMAAQYDALSRMNKNNINRNNEAFFLNEEAGSGQSVDVIRMNVWMKMLEQGAYEAVLVETEQYLDGLKAVGGLQAEVLQRFFQSFLQMLYHYFQFKEWQAYQVLGEDISVERMSEAARSVTDLQIWVRALLTRTIDFGRLTDDTQTVMDKVKQYIAHNVGQSISREEIARHVHLHPDYLSRLFKKETGQSIVEYILEEKIRIAKNLLSGTELSVSDIAACVGYSNFSYFAKVFKSAVHMNPNEFRRTARKASSLS